MDKFRKALLGAASLLALNASGQKSADAAIPPVDAAKTVDTGAASAAPSAPLFELMARTNGSFERQTVENALREMFADPSAAQLEALPMLLADLSGLGAPSNVIARSRDVLIELVSKAPNISDDVIATTLSELEQTGVFQLAAADDDKKRRRRRREPEEIGQVPGGGAAS